MYSKKDNVRIGYIKYEASHMAIPIVFIKEDFVKYYLRIGRISIKLYGERQLKRRLAGSMKLFHKEQDTMVFHI